MHGPMNVKFTLSEILFPNLTDANFEPVERTQCPNVAECGYRPSGTRFKTGSSYMYCIAPWRL